MNNDELLKFLMDRVKLTFSQALWLRCNTRPLKQLVKTLQVNDIKPSKDKPSLEFKRLDIMLGGD